MIYETTVPAFVKGLRNLSEILGKGAQFADAKKIPFDVLMNSRLAVDQFPLVRQVQIACDTAKLGAARLAGVTAPAHEDNEKSLPELQARIHSTISFLEGLKKEQFAEAATRHVTTPRWEGKYLTGEEFVQHHAFPNFYFHLTTAYAVLRHNGVEVGKKDYLGPIPYRS